MKYFKLTSLLVIFLFINSPEMAIADIGGLTKCSNSPAFNKRQCIFGTSKSPLKSFRKTIKMDGLGFY